MGLIDTLNRTAAALENKAKRLTHLKLLNAQDVVVLILFILLKDSVKARV